MRNSLWKEKWRKFTYFIVLWCPTTILSGLPLPPTPLKILARPCHQAKTICDLTQLWATSILISHTSCSSGCSDDRIMDLALLSRVKYYSVLMYFGGVTSSCVLTQAATVHVSGCFLDNLFFYCRNLKSTRFWLTSCVTWRLTARSRRTTLSCSRRSASCSLTCATSQRSSPWSVYIHVHTHT